MISLQKSSRIDVSRLRSHLPLVLVCSAVKLIVGPGKYQLFWRVKMKVENRTPHHSSLKCP